jgi:hypothetical protein
VTGRNTEVEESELILAVPAAETVGAVADTRTTHGCAAAAARMTTAVTDTITTNKPRIGRRLPARRGAAWDADEVARHLMSCRAQMICGLRRRTPWVGLDADTLDSCFGLGAALISRMAATGERPEWRTAGDLEKAQVAAFRNQTYDHWKRINAQSRQGDRHAVAFDPERHASQEASIDRLLELPDVASVRRDLLAEIDDEDLRRFWAPVLEEAINFKSAGDRLGLTKAQVMSRTRAGRAIFEGYFERRETGELCHQRGRDIAALRGGNAGAAAAGRAQAHLESCYPCALSHEPNSGAFERGLLSAGPLGMVLRLVPRASDVAGFPAAGRPAADACVRLLAGGLAAIAVVGTGAGVHAVRHDRVAPAHSKVPARAHPRAVARPAARDNLQAVRIPARHRAVAKTHRPVSRPATRAQKASRVISGAPPRRGTKEAAGTGGAEFTVEQATASWGASTPSPSHSTSKTPTTGPAIEFAGP